jgi:hypothetical protein
LSPKVNLDIYQLFPIVNAGIVHTTTVGIEMAARGLPVITTASAPYSGFGFTVEPASEGEYFEVLRKTLMGEKLLDPDEQIGLSYKFIMFYQYHYYTKIDIMKYVWGETPRLKIRSIKDLFPGKNIFLDYVADSIVDGLPIVCEDRWPPES